MTPSGIACRKVFIFLYLDFWNLLEFYVEII